MNKLPDWSSWKVELSSHVLKRMVDRQFNEADLRLMLEDTSGYHENHEPGRWVVETRREHRSWEIIVEPLRAEKILLIIIAYAVE